LEDADNALFDKAFFQTIYKEKKQKIPFHHSPVVVVIFPSRKKINKNATVFREARMSL
jgi:hypothetical protein